jgi:hypothetical protein
VLFVLVLLTHQRRRIIHVNITEHPTAVWTAQQLIEAFPEDKAPRWLLRDRDAIYGDVFRRRTASMGIGEVVSSPSSPWQNRSFRDNEPKTCASIAAMCARRIFVRSPRVCGRTPLD